MNKEEVIEKIGAKRWKEFCEFMIGQTVGSYANGSLDYYEIDVENFLRKKSKRFFD